MICILEGIALVPVEPQALHGLFHRIRIEAARLVRNTFVLPL